jgi:hypothetical protein
MKIERRDNVHQSKSRARVISTTVVRTTVRKAYSRAHTTLLKKSNWNSVNIDWCVRVKVTFHSNLSKRLLSLNTSVDIYWITVCFFNSVSEYHMHVFTRVNENYIGSVSRKWMKGSHAPIKMEENFTVTMQRQRHGHRKNWGTLSPTVANWGEKVTCTRTMEGHGHVQTKHRQSWAASWKGSSAGASPVASSLWPARRPWQAGGPVCMNMVPRDSVGGPGEGGSKSENRMYPRCIFTGFRCESYGEWKVSTLEKV